jgi:hypothetical protein
VERLRVARVVLEDRVIRGDGVGELAVAMQCGSTRASSVTVRHEQDGRTRERLNEPRQRL